jgi:hypothetical protein
MTTTTRHRNDTMTKFCQHGPSQVCDYCVIAFDDHESRDDAPMRGHHIDPKDPRSQRYVCKSCTSLRDMKKKPRTKRVLVSVRIDGVVLGETHADVPSTLAKSCAKVLLALGKDPDLDIAWERLPTNAQKDMASRELRWLRGKR